MAGCPVWTSRVVVSTSTLQSAGDPPRRLITSRLASAPGSAPSLRLRAVPSSSEVAACAASIPSSSNLQPSRRWARRCAKRRPTLPKPTSARSARMRQKRIQELTGDRQRLREIRLFRAKANPEIALHVEIAAGQQKHTLRVAQAGGEPFRFDPVTVPDEDNGAGVGR